jgi:hypothetical protein
LEVRVLPGSPLSCDLINALRHCASCDYAAQFSRFTHIGGFLHIWPAIHFTPILASPDAQRFIVPLWALSCKIPARTALALLSCGRPSRWPPDLLLRSAGRNAQFTDFRRPVTTRMEN